jgi:cytochrome c biogenesis protein CcmG/thiol:disulfide interchange protein DsbE
LFATAADSIWLRRGWVVQIARFSAIRGRIIPAIAITLVVALLGLLAWTLLGPKSADTAQSGRVNAPGVFIRFTNRQAPNFTLTDFNSGKKVSLSDLRGKTVIVNFWASWCDPCQTEAPLISNYVKQNTNGNVVVLGVATWDTNSNAEKFIQQYGLTYPIGADSSGNIAIDYGVAGVPETFIVSPTGELMGKFPGAVENTAQLSNALKETTGG